jgi:flagellar assembly protein FliH
MNLSKSVIKAEEIKLVGRIHALPVAFAAAAFGQQEAAECREKSDDSEKKDRLEADIARVRSEAYTRGLAEGVKKGQEQSKKKYGDMIAAVNALTRELGALKRKIFAEAEEQVLDLAFAMAAKVIHQEVATNQDVIIGVLQEAVKNIVERDGLKIRLNPQDYRYIVEMKPDFLPRLVGVKNVSLEEDASVSRGGTVIETAHGEIDARLDRQLTEIRSAMRHGQEG